MKSLISDIKSNKFQLLEASLAAGDLLVSGLSLSGTYNLGKTFFNIFGSKQKIHEARKNSPEFQITNHQDTRQQSKCDFGPLESEKL